MKKMLTMVGAVFLAVALTVLLKNQYGSMFSGDTYGIPAAISMGEIDHLFIGSSMFRQGLDIDVLEEELGENVYILSYNGNQPVFMAQELEYLVSHGVKIKNLYIDFYAFTATASPWISDTKMFLDTDLKFKLQAWNLMKESNDTKFSDFYEMFVTANNEQILMFPVNKPIVSSQFRKGGSLLEMSGQTEEHLDTLDLGVRDGLHPVQIEGYEKIVSIAREQGMNLLFLETPKYEKLIRDDRKGAYPELLKDMKKEAERMNAPCLFADQLEFDHRKGANFQDLIHLSAEGRRAYCRMLCVHLRELQGTQSSR